MREGGSRTAPTAPPSPEGTGVRIPCAILRAAKGAWCMAHDTSLAIRVSPDAKVRLRDYDPADVGGMRREEAETRTAQLGAEFSEMQELLYGAARQSVLIVLQGMDTSGKDGTIRHVMAPINPQGCTVVAFKQPTAA